jgi:hypothetical protein
MLFWNDPHHACFSGKTLIMYAFLEWKACMMRVIPEKHTWWESFQKGIHDEGHSRKAYLMRVIPEKHTWWTHYVCFSGMTLIMYSLMERPSSCMLFWNDSHRVCFSGMTLIMLAFLERPSSCMLFFPEKHI